ncbi:MAG: hypothetical protein COA69_04310 [Robiginitomaculum sp.]|nr:MAG: hypothetical protein COA69_04310 [Robiginitomaculum sp.]
MRTLIWILGAGVVFGVGLTVYSFAKTPATIAQAKANMVHGEELYAKNCAACHGADLGGGLAANLADDVWVNAKTASEITAMIKNGNDDLGMPGFGDQLSDSDIADVHIFIKSQAGRQKVTAATEAKSGSTLVETEVWIDGLDAPWALVFTSAHHALLTEKSSGEIFEVIDGKKAEMPVSGVPKVNSKGQGGLLDVAIDPDYAENGWIYISFSHQLENGKDLNMTKVVRAHIKQGRWIDEQTLFEAKLEHYLGTHHHYGSRITFDESGHMFFSVGERGKKDMAQDITRPNGKIHRLMRDGSVPKDNPFLENPKAYPSIFSYGHRNPQGLIYTDGRLWDTEHGPRGGDELNLIKAGANYGWPVISYGINYSGTVLTPYTHMEGMEQPVSQWTPSIAACGLDVVSGEMFKDWDGYLLAGALKFKELRLIALEDGQYVSEQILLKDKGRVRDVTTGPDGAIYVVLNDPGQILRLTPGSGYKGE